METHGLKIYGFYDGDFTFHHVGYEGLPGAGSTFRVRIDNDDPEHRHRENTGNPNQFLDHPHTIRPATEREIRLWLSFFHRVLPLRGPDATEGLRHLRLHGPARPSELRGSVEARMWRLTRPVPVARDFKCEWLVFVEMIDGRFQLTEDGRWLTSLMR